MNVVDFAHQIIQMQRRIDWLEEEVERLRFIEAKHDKDVMDSIRHGEKMMVGFLDLLVSDRVTINPVADKETEVTSEH